MLKLFKHKPKRNDYLLAYSFHTPKGSGFGNIDVSFTGPLTSDRINELRDLIKSRNDGFTDVIILNVIPMEPTND
jgi:hypothetical protein